MRVVAVVGSNRRGNTYAMVEAACHAMPDLDVELLHVKDLLDAMCDGCLTCDVTGECHIGDEMTRTVTSVREADGFIFGTPARWGLLSGELKVFFDRLNPLAVPEQLNGKKALILAVGQCEGDEALSIRQAADSVETFCENAGIEVVERVIAEGCTKPTDAIERHPEILEQCRTAARKLSEVLLNGL